MSNADGMLQKFMLHVLIVMFALCPMAGAQNEQLFPQEEETVYLTEAAKKILEEDWDESIHAEEGIMDMRYVVFTMDDENGGWPGGGWPGHDDRVVGIRLRYPSPVDINALSLASYEAVGYPHSALFINNDGTWGHAESTGEYVFLIFQDVKSMREMMVLQEQQEPDAVVCECGLHIDIWQKDTIWLMNGSYVPRHMFIATEGYYPDME